MDDPYRPRTQWRLILAVGGGLLVATFWAWTHLEWAGPLATRAFVDATLTLLPLGAAALCWLRARHLPNPRKGAWILMGAGSAAWGAGSLAWTYLELVAQRGIPVAERSIPFPSVADVGYLAMIVLLAIALLGMVIGSTPVTTRLRTLLDGLLIAFAALFMAWTFLLRDIAQFAGQQDSPLAQAVALAYPLGDLTLLSLLLLLASRAHAGVRHTLAWLGLALACFAVADLGFWYLTARGVYASGSWTDIGWLLAFLLIAYAAIRPIPAIDDEEVPQPGIWLSLLPLAPFAVATLTAMGVQIMEGALSPFLFWNAVFVVVVLFARQMVVLLENIQLRRKVEAALAQAHRLQAERSAALRAIAHDLQNPLSPIQIQLSLMRARTQQPPDVRSLAILDRNVAQVSRLVQDLSDLARIQDARLSLEPVDVDVHALVLAAVESERENAKQRGVTLTAHGSRAPVHADGVRIAQVLANLVRNALKFTPAGGKVVVSALATPRGARVEVRDNGRGLDAASRTRLFQPFVQVHDRSSQDPMDRGSGLGLFICKGIIDAHGGTIAVDSDGPGTGSTFWFELPAQGTSGSGTSPDLASTEPQEPDAKRPTDP